MLCVLFASGGGAGSWPITAFGATVYRGTGMDDCTKAAALADFLLWSQTDALALRNAVRFAFSLFPSLRRFVLSLTGRTTHTRHNGR